MTSYLDVLILDKNQIWSVPVEKALSETLEIPCDMSANTPELKIARYNVTEYDFEGKTYLLASGFGLSHLDLDNILRQKIAEGLTPVN